MWELKVSYFTEFLGLENRAGLFQTYIRNYIFVYTVFGLCVIAGLYMDRFLMDNNECGLLS